MGKVMHLTNWASINQKSAIEQLRKIALDERWNYAVPNEDYPSPILARYLKWTFYKLYLDDKIIYQNNYAAFNTGLVDKFYKPIYAIFDQNKIPDKQKWHFYNFCVAGSSTKAARILADYFPILPERAQYIANYDDIMYDTNLSVDVNWEHIVLKNLDRLPHNLIKQVCIGLIDEQINFDTLTEEEKKKYYDDLRQVLSESTPHLSLISNMMTMALETAKLRAAWNYKTAIPIYYPTDDKVHLILPLALNINNPEEISIALVMTKTPAGRYRAVTIFTLEMAYSNARLVTKPSSDWLIADRIQ